MIKFNNLIVAHVLNETLNPTHSLCHCGELSSLICLGWFFSLMVSRINQKAANEGMIEICK